MVDEQPDEWEQAEMRRDREEACIEDQPSGRERVVADDRKYENHS